MIALLPNQASVIKTFLALLTHRNALTGRCDPSIATLAAETGVARRSVIRALQTLRETGWVMWDLNRPGKRSRYTLKTSDANGTCDKPGTSSGDADGPQPVTRMVGTDDAYGTRTANNSEETEKANSSAAIFAENEMIEALTRHGICRQVAQKLVTDHAVAARSVAHFDAAAFPGVQNIAAFLTARIRADEPFEARPAKLSTAETIAAMGDEVPGWLKRLHAQEHV